MSGVKKTFNNPRYDKNFPDAYRDQGKDQEKAMRTVLNFFSAVGFVILTGLMAVSGNSLATTPDGETPANEGVCDVLKMDGITKGLYGLCVAYCEAQDLNDMNKEPPSTRILANYNKKKQAGDPDMPCLQPPPNCPCWTTAELESIFTDGVSGTCTSSSDQTQFIDFTPVFQAAQGTVNGSAGSTCGFTDLSTGKSLFVNISESDATVCKTQVEAMCDMYVPAAP